MKVAVPIYSGTFRVGHDKIYTGTGDFLTFSSIPKVTAVIF